MLINLRNALMAGKRLPFDAEVEYLESTGTQWIDTGFRPDLSTVSCKTSMVVETIQISNLYGWFGLRTVASSATATTCSIVGNTNTGSRSVRTDWGKYDNYIFTYGETLNFECGTGSIVKINNQVFFSDIQKNTGRVDINFYIFSVNSVGSPMAPVAARIKYFQIFDGTTLVRDFIPVRVGTVGYMFDRVSKRLFGNQGTGAFIFGPDK